MISAFILAFVSLSLLIVFAPLLYELYKPSRARFFDAELDIPFDTMKAALKRQQKQQQQSKEQAEQAKLKQKYASAPATLGGGASPASKHSSGSTSSAAAFTTQQAAAPDSPASLKRTGSSQPQFDSTGSTGSGAATPTGRDSKRFERAPMLPQLSADLKGDPCFGVI
jgi:hypothetical protein